MVATFSESRSIFSLIRFSRLSFVSTRGLATKVKAHADEASRATAATNFMVELCTDEGNNTRSFCDADSGDEVCEKSAMAVIFLC